MNLLRKPVVILVNVAVAAIVGAFAYTYKSKAAVASDYTDGSFGNMIRMTMEKNNSNGNICIVASIAFLGLAIAGIVLFAKHKNAQNGKNQSEV